MGKCQLRTSFNSILKRLSRMQICFDGHGIHYQFGREVLIETFELILIDCIIQQCMIEINIIPIKGKINCFCGRHYVIHSIYLYSQKIHSVLHRLHYNNRSYFNCFSNSLPSSSHCYRTL